MNFTPDILIAVELHYIYRVAQNVSRNKIIKKSYKIALKPVNEIRFLRQIKSSINKILFVGNKYSVYDLLYDVINNSWSHTVNDVSAPSGISSPQQAVNFILNHLLNEDICKNISSIFRFFSGFKSRF